MGTSIAFGCDWYRSLTAAWPRAMLRLQVSERPKSSAQLGSAICQPLWCTGSGSDGRWPPVSGSCTFVQAKLGSAAMRKRHVILISATALVGRFCALHRLRFASGLRRSPSDELTLGPIKEKPAGNCPRRVSLCCTLAGALGVHSAIVSKITSGGKILVTRQREPAGSSDRTLRKRPGRVSVE